MPQINITTQVPIEVPPNVSTLLLAENVMARYRRIEVVTHALVFVSIDGTAGAFRKGIPMIPFQSHILEWMSDLPAGDIPNMDMFAFTIYDAAPVFVSVIEGE